MTRPFLLTFASMTLALLGCSDHPLQTSAPTISIAFQKLNEHLIIEPRVWGVAGNHQQILVKTDSTKRAYDQDEDYAFVSDEIYYRHTSDSLVIYAPSDAIMPFPTLWGSRVIVSCNGLDGYDTMIDYRKNYAKYGLQRVSVYPNSHPSPSSRP